MLVGFVVLLSLPGHPGPENSDLRYQSQLVAIDIDGQTLWSTDIHYAPLPMIIGDGQIDVVYGRLDQPGGVVAIGFDGTPRWDTEIPGRLQRWHSTPDLIVIPSSVRIEGAVQPWLGAIDAADGSVRWETSGRLPIDTGLVDEVFVELDEHGDVAGYDLSTGAVRFAATPQPAETLPAAGVAYLHHRTRIVAVEADGTATRLALGADLARILAIRDGVAIVDANLNGESIIGGVALSDGAFAWQ